MRKGALATLIMASYCSHAINLDELLKGSQLVDNTSNELAQTRSWTERSYADLNEPSIDTASMLVQIAREIEALAQT